MKTILFILFELTLVHIIVCANNLYTLRLIRYRTRKLSYHNRLKNTIESGTNRMILRSRNKLQPLITGMDFPCKLNNTRSPTRPTSIHMLRPGDIDVIGAIGDSLSVGVGLTATKFREVYFENRGIAPSAGGQGSWKEYLTLPNILKEFNGNLTGYAKEPAITLQENSQFNIAELGAISSDIVNMGINLIARIRSSPNVDFYKDWKMITMMVGPNDFCAHICYEKDLEEILERHRQDYINLFRLLRDHLPRTFVNLVPAPNLKTLIGFTKKPVFCKLNHSFVCPCLVGQVFRQRREEFIRFMARWQQVEQEVAEMPEFDTDNFTVVVQPFTLNLDLPKKEDGATDYSYLSEDCFHFSQKFNAIVANSLWNNLLEPVGNKSTKESRFIEEFRCPSIENPFIFTKRNS